MQALLKPGDIVRTPTGRRARIREVLPARERHIVFMDGRREAAIMRASHLVLIHEAPVKPWIHRKPVDAED